LPHLLFSSFSLLLFSPCLLRNGNSRKTSRIRITLMTLFRLESSSSLFLFSLDLILFLLLSLTKQAFFFIQSSLFPYCFSNSTIHLFSIRIFYNKHRYFPIPNNFFVLYFSIQTIDKHRLYLYVDAILLLVPIEYISLDQRR